jgi:hypothetical protein
VLFSEVRDVCTTVFCARCLCQVRGGAVAVYSNMHDECEAQKQTQIWKCAKSMNNKGCIFDRNLSTARRGCNRVWGGD